MDCLVQKSMSVNLLTAAAKATAPTLLDLSSVPVLRVLASSPVADVPELAMSVKMLSQMKNVTPTARKSAHLPR